MRLLLHRLCLYRFISFGLQSSKGCVYWWNVGACTGLLVSGHYYLLDTSISALLVPLWPPTYGVFGHLEPPYKKVFWDSMPANNFLQVGYVAGDSWIILLEIRCHAQLETTPQFGMADFPSLNIAGRLCI